MLPIRRRQTTVPQVVTLIAGNKQRSLLIVGDDDELFMTRSLNITPKTTEQHLTARNDKSVAYVTNNKRLCSTFCTTGAGNKQRSLLIVGDNDELFMTRSLNITPKTTEQHLIARSDKSVAYVTNSKRLCSTFCTTGATTTLQTKLRHFYVITKYSSAYKPWTAGRELRP